VPIPDLRCRRGCEGQKSNRLRITAMLVLEPIFETDLPPEQYAYRPGRNNRQACQLRGSEEGDHARHRASPTQGIEQPRGEFAPANAPTGAANEAVQIARPAPAVPLRPRIRSTTCFICVAITSLPPSTEPPGCRHSESGQKSAALPLRCNRKRTLYIAQSRESLTTAEQVDGAPSASIITARAGCPGGICAAVTADS